MFVRRVGGSWSGAAYENLRGFDSLESRAMLAADDIVVGLVNNEVVLTLDPAGVQITDLNTTYSAASSTLTITAVRNAGTISTAGPISGIRVDSATDTIEVDLTTIQSFAGISVVGAAGVDAITIGSGGVDLAAVTQGAANQSFSIDTGAGSADTITVAASLSSKAAGGVSLTTLGTGLNYGIQVAAPVTTPQGSQTFAGGMLLQQSMSLTAGGNIAFSSTVDGTGRLTLSAGQAITLDGAVGGTLPLQGLTLSAATSVAVNQSLALDGTGTSLGDDGLVIAANVNNVVFSPAASGNARAISGFSGSGIRFVGGSTGSRITNLSSIGNGVGLLVDAGSYSGTVISGNSFIGSTGDGVTLNAAKGITIGGTATGASNAIIFNAGYGLNASGSSTGSVVEGNQLSNNVLGNVKDLAVTQLFVQVPAAPGLTVRMTALGQAASNANGSGLYAFDMAMSVNGVSISSTGAVSTREALVDIDVDIQAQSTEMRKLGSVIYVDAQQLGATGLPWVSVGNDP